MRIATALIAALLLAACDRAPIFTPTPQTSPDPANVVEPAPWPDGQPK